MEPHQMLIASPRPSRWRAERGSTVVETAILAPVLVFVTFLVFQTAFYYHDRNIVSSAAQVGVEAARVEGAGPAAGQQAASSFLAQAAPNLRGTSVSASSNGSTVTVVVTANATALVPLVSPPPVRITATGPIEAVSSP